MVIGSRSKPCKPPNSEFLGRPHIDSLIRRGASVWTDYPITGAHNIATYTVSDSTNYTKTTTTYKTTTL